MSENPRRISLIGSRATSVLSVALVLIVVGLCATIGIAVHEASKAVGDGTTLLVTTLPGEDPLTVGDIGRTFNDASWADRFEYIEASEVLSREVDTMTPTELEALELLSENPFGDEFVVYIAEGWRGGDSISVICDRLRAMPAVDQVSGITPDIAQVNDGMERIVLYLSILALVLLVISIALINNTISLSIYSRRFNIHTMKLVGATNSFIRRPFVRAGMVTGIIAGFLAMIVVCAIQSYLMYNDTLIGPWVTIPEIVCTGACLIVTGALIARAAAWRAATVYLRKSYDSLFRK